MTAGRGWPAVAIVLLAIPGCSTPSPTSPTGLPPATAVGQPPDLTSGTYVVGMQGFDGSSDPRLPPCAPFGVPASGKRVETLVSLTADGSGWIGRTVAPGVGALEIRVRTVLDQPLERRVIGTVAGHALDAGPAPTIGPGPTGVRIDIDGTVDATMTLAGVTAIGNASGRMRFADAQGAADCTNVLITMTRRP